MIKERSLSSVGLRDNRIREVKDNYFEKFCLKGEQRKRAIAVGEYEVKGKFLFLIWKNNSMYAC